MRRGVDFEWSDQSWVHNIFRVYELIFWRRDGIRCESVTNAFDDGEGSVHVEYKTYTFEATCAYIETAVRKRLFTVPRIVWVPTLAPVMMSNGTIALQPHGYRFAIAFDNSSEGFTGGGAGTTITYSHTNTGSNLILLVGTGILDSGVTTTGVTYAAVAVTSIAVATENPTSNALFQKIAPATGANNVVATRSSNSGSGYRSSCASYTGCDQTQAGQQTDTSISTTGTSLPLDITVGTAGWFVMTAVDGTNGIATSVTNGTIRENSFLTIADSNADVSGATTLTYVGSSSWVSASGTACVIVPSGGGVVAKPWKSNLPLMGAG